MLCLDSIAPREIIDAANGVDESTGNDFGGRTVSFCTDAVSGQICVLCRFMHSCLVGGIQSALFAFNHRVRRLGVYV